MSSLLQAPNVVERLSTFTTTGVWLCPADVTSVVITAFGGGGSGAGAGLGGTTIGAAGGGGAIMSSQAIAVVPGTLYIVTIGAGGAAVAASTAGNPGGDTSFIAAGGVVTALGIWSGASGGNTVSGAGGGGGLCFKATGGTNANADTTVSTTVGTMAGGGSSSGSASLAGLTGFRNVVGGFDGGAAGTVSGVDSGGSGGGAGPEGVGGAGGNGAGGTGGVGGSAAANTGAGGGGGGGGAVGGASGAGGSGKLYISYKSQFAYPPLPKVVQFVPLETSFGQPTVATFSSNVTAGNAIVVLCLANGNPAFSFDGVTDSELNPFNGCQNTFFNDGVNHWQTGAFVAFNVFGGTADVVTLNQSGGGAGNAICFYCFEVSGLLGYEGGSASSAASGTAMTSGTVPITHDFGIILAATLAAGSADPTHPAGAGFVLIQRTAGDAACLEYATGVSAPLAATALLQGSASWAMVAAGFNGLN